MLRDVGVRTKLLAVLAIPTMLLALLTSLLVSQQVGVAQRADRVAALTDVAVQANRVAHSLQRERSLTRLHLAATGPDGKDDSAGAAAVKAQRISSDQELSRFITALDEAPVESSPDVVRVAITRSIQRHASLSAVRSQIDAGTLDSGQVDEVYASLVQGDLDLPEALAAIATVDLASRLRSYRSMSVAIETASRERDLIELALVRGSLTRADLALAAAQMAEQNLVLDDVRRSAPPETVTALVRRLDGPSSATVEKVRGDLSRLLTGGSPSKTRSAEWAGAADERIGAMTAAENSLVGDVGELAVATKDTQHQRTTVLIAVALVGLGLAVMLAVGLARRITRPLRHLTEAAVGIRHELPQMVERMLTPGEGPGLVLEPIKVTSRDEVGRLAEAFNSVNDMTVAVARDQAALRAGISEMFVNVARRNQVLLGRQLAALDRMESREEDPEVLASLYSLDHLATRMRRNAESLLVLAGIDSTRRLRVPMPLSDVVRTAVGEIEAYERIELAMTQDVDVSGRHALLVAHLLAELLENATHFSDPDTAVMVGATVTADGVELTVTDRGLGMSGEEIVEANDRIAHPPVTEIAVSQRFGLYVVGRLADRLGAQVVLSPGVGAGLAVTVSLPASVLDRPGVVAGPRFVLVDDIDTDIDTGADTDTDTGADTDTVPPVLVQSPPPTVPPAAPASAPPAPAPSVFPQLAMPMQRPIAMPEQPAFLWQPPASEENATRALPSRGSATTPGSGRHRAPADDSAPAPDAATVEPLGSLLPDVAMVEPLGSLLPEPAPPAPLTPPAPVTPPAAPASAPPAPLARRTPKGSPTVEPSFALAPPAGPRPRTAEDVRGMLAGFRSGVARGRDESASTPVPPAAAVEEPRTPNDRQAAQHGPLEQHQPPEQHEPYPRHQPYPQHEPYEPKDETP